ncbi:MAG: ATPase [Mesorhizobium amorphae]|nr:MAG: ATPase [Mesorhizobium amorphae]
MDRFAQPRFHVVTGGPGGGKTTLLDHLATLGFPVMPEAGRGVIREELASGGTALPWADRAAFARRMADWEMRNLSDAEKLEGPVFFDRGLPDTLGYLVLEGLPVPPTLEEAAARTRYASPVFLAPFWPEIYLQDAERKQSAEIAARTCDVMDETYRRLGYKVLALPKVGIKERAAFLLRAAALARPFPVVGQSRLH